METTSNAEYIQKRCFNLLVWTLQHFTSKFQHFFLTHNRSFQPFRDEVQFWDTGNRSNAGARECAHKIKSNIYPYWQARYRDSGNNHRAFTELATDLLNPASSLCQMLKITDDNYHGLHVELIGAAVSHIITSEALSANDADRRSRFNFQDVLDMAATDVNPNPEQYKKIKYSNLIAVLNYSAQHSQITPDNIHIYLAEYLYARLSSFKQRVPAGFIPILLPLRGLGQWRAMAGWICPANRQLKEHLRVVRKVQPESLIQAIEEIYSGNLIDAFIFLIENVLLKLTDSAQRMRKAADVFSQLWIADEIRFYRDNMPILRYAADGQSATADTQAWPGGEAGTERSKLLVIEESADNRATVAVNLNRHEDVYLLRKALGFDLVIFKDCPRVQLNLPGQEEYWEAQLKEKLARTAAAIIKEQYLLTQGLTHEIMNTLSRRSRYRVLYAKALNNEPINNAEFLYTCSILQELYYLTDAIRTVTKFDDPRGYLMKLVSRSGPFELGAYAAHWRATIQAVIQQLLFGINYLGTVPVIFHDDNCRRAVACLCPPLPTDNPVSQTPSFVPFAAEANSLFLVGIHEILGNAVQYLVKQAAMQAQMGGFMSEPLDCRIDVEFASVIEEDRYYQLIVGNPVQRDEKPKQLSDGLKRTENLLSCFLFRDQQGRERRLVEFSLVAQPRPDYHAIAIRFRPHLVFTGGAQ